MYELLEGRLILNNPIIAASGTVGYGSQFVQRVGVKNVGGVVCKGVTLQPRAGHSPPRIVETAAGALNAIGLANIGVDGLIRDVLPAWSRIATPMIVNVNGESIAEYVEVVRKLDAVDGVAAIELNISCPNVARGGMAFGMEPVAAFEVTRAVREATSLPLLVKLTPNTCEVSQVARSVVKAGADALTVANTYLGLQVDTGKRKPSLTNTTGGLSGPAIKPLTVRLVYELASIVPVPLIGCGGIMNGQDAVEYLMAGATAVQVGTATLIDPYAVPRIARELAQWLEKHATGGVASVIGAALSHPTTSSLP